MSKNASNHAKLAKMPKIAQKKPKTFNQTREKTNKNEHSCEKLAHVARASFSISDHIASPLRHRTLLPEILALPQGVFWFAMSHTKPNQKKQWCSLPAACFLREAAPEEKAQK